MTVDPGNLSSSSPSNKDKIYIGDGAGLKISQTGKTILLSSLSPIALQNVLVVQQ